MARIALIVLRLALGGVFLYAGASKIGSAVEFADSIRHYDLVPWPWAVTALALWLPWIEIATGLGMVFRRFYPGALTLALGMTVVFVAALSIARARGLDIRCGCFGHDEASVLRDFAKLLARDLALLAGAAILLVEEVFRKPVARKPSPVPQDDP